MPDTDHGLVVEKELPPPRVKAAAIVKVAAGVRPWGLQSARRLATTVTCHLGDQGWANVCSPAELTDGAVIRVISKLDWRQLERCLNGALISHHVSSSNVVVRKTNVAPSIRRNEVQAARLQRMIH